jgi:hypothetical protein
MDLQGRVLVTIIRRKVLRFRVNLL